MDAPKPTGVDPRSSRRRDLLRGAIALALALAPSLLAIALVPEFSTQDGPAHLYNARILNASLGVGGREATATATAETFEVAWRPLPNWAGHLGTMALVATLPPGVAGRAMSALTLVAFAASVFWLRWSVADREGLIPSAVLASLLALNVTWLLGFTSFTLGASMMAATLAAWWGGREGFGPPRAFGIAILLVVGYFCHPISLGLTVVGLGVLATLTPGVDRARRLAWTLASLAPLVPLGLAYRALTRSGGGLEPVWEHLANPWSLKSWANQAGWVDPITLAAKTFRPFGTTSSALNGLISPAAWTVGALGILALATWKRRADDRVGWLVLAALLLVGGLIGPDTLGVKHGHYLPQRIVLLGMMALVPWLDFEVGNRRRAARVAVGMLGFALAVQSAFVWDYAITCRDRIGPLLEAGRSLGPGRRVGTLLVGIKGRFRANPMMHADCLLGADPGSDAVIWNNYETAHYYFPVKVRNGLDHPLAVEFERVALLDDPSRAAERAEAWSSLLSGHLGSIDAIVEWGTPDPGLDAINARWYEPTRQIGPARVWERRGVAETAGR